MAQERPEPHNPLPINEHENIHEEKNEDVDEEKDDVWGGGGRASERTHCSEPQHTPSLSLPLSLSFSLSPPRHFPSGYDRIGQSATPLD
jgi:hypothetical protein